MPTVEEAFAGFERTMNRVDGLLELHGTLHGRRGRPTQEVSDVLRGALVLALAALDALVLDCVAAAIPGAAKNGTLGDYVKKWAKEDPDVFLAAFAEENPNETLSVIAAEKLGMMTFQKAETIGAVLTGVLGAEAPWARASELLMEDEDGGFEYDAQVVMTDLNGLTARRNRIAHSGDRNAAGTATTTIQRAYVQEAARLIRAIGVAVADTAEAIEST